MPCEFQIHVTNPDSCTCNHAKVMASVAIYIANIGGTTIVFRLSTTTILRATTHVIVMFTFEFTCKIITGKATYMYINSKHIVKLVFIAYIDWRELHIISIQLIAVSSFGI